MKAAKRMPRGTVFIMSNGSLYMANASKMYDHAGMLSFGGDYQSSRRLLGPAAQPVCLSPMRRGVVGAQGFEPWTR